MTSFMDQKTQDRIERLVYRAIELLLLPFRPLVSKSAQKAYLITVLFGITSIILLGVASVAFWIFYYEYVPQPGVERQIHLQFGNDNPQGLTRFPGALISDQAYDIYLSVHLPRTIRNLDAGNFMLSLSLFPFTSSSSVSQTLLPTALAPDNSSIAHSSRPAILTHLSELTSTASTLSFLPLYVTGLSSESELLNIPMFEGVEFLRGARNIPDAASLIIQSDQKMQFYSVTLSIIAKLSGLRWILYNHRILSFLVFTSAFWMSSVISMAFAWLALSLYLGITKDMKSEGSSNGSSVKQELEQRTDGSEPQLSDTSRSFPTIGRQRPLKYEGASIKQEGEGLVEAARLPLQAVAGDADDEEDFEDAGASSAFRDSGIGTGREEPSEGLQRRRKGVPGLEL